VWRLRQDLPTGRREQVPGGGRFQHRPGRFAHGGDRGVESGPAGRPLGGVRTDRQADGKFAAVGRERSQLAEQCPQDRQVQVDGDPFKEEQAGLFGRQPGRGEQARHGIGGEVGGDEVDVPAVDPQAPQAPSLVLLGGGVIDFEPVHTGFGVSQGAAVVARRADHDLRAAAGQGAGDGAVEKQRPRPQVLPHRPGLRADPCGHVPCQPVIGGRIAVRGGHPVEHQPVRGDPLRRHRGLPRVHSAKACGRGWRYSRACTVPWRPRDGELPPGA
jgi:hypothetical protein